MQYALHFLDGGKVLQDLVLRSVLKSSELIAVSFTVVPVHRRAAAPDVAIVAKDTASAGIEPAMQLPDEHIGIRLEDMILVTDAGYENLSASVPVEIDEIERTMQEAGLRR